MTPHNSPHADATRTYALVFAALLALMAATVAAAAFDLGALGAPVALGIAAVKAALVVLVFMHVRESSRVVWLFAAAGLAWLAILMSLTLTDYLSRGWFPDGR